MKMKLLVFASLLLIPTVASAAVTISVHPTGTLNTTLDYDDADAVPATIVVDIVITTGASDWVLGFGTWLKETSWDGDTNFSITGRVQTLQPAGWTYLSPDTYAIKTGAPGVVDVPGNQLDEGVNAVDLGAHGGGVNYFGGVGNTVVTTITLSTSNMNTSPADDDKTYTIAPNASKDGAGFEWVDYYNQGTPSAFAGVGTLTINVAPEPATALLLVGLLPFLRRRRA